MISDDGVLYSSPFIYWAFCSLYSSDRFMETTEKFLVPVFLFSILDVYDGRH